MKQLLVIALVLAAVVACGDRNETTSTPRIVLIPCDPEQCSAPRECHPIDGVSLCVLTCGPGAPCEPDEMPITLTGATTCTCVPQAPTGRSCAADADCAWGPDVSGAAHLCVGHGGGTVCQPLGVSCNATSDCAGGYACDAATRVCIKPTGFMHKWRRDADMDVRCTQESQLMPNPGPGVGWRQNGDCLGQERPECDDYAMFTCSPDDRELFGSVLRVGTVHTPGLKFTSESGETFLVLGHLMESLSKFEGGNRLRVLGNVTRPPGSLPNLYVTGWWLERAGTDTPEIGRLRVQDRDYYLERPGGSVRITTTNATIQGHLPNFVGWKVWVVGKPESGAYRIWRFGGLYKPDVP